METSTLGKKGNKIMDEELIFGLIFLLCIGLVVAFFGGLFIADHKKEMAIIERGNVMVCPACYATLKLVREDL